MMKSEDRREDNPIQKGFFDRAFALLKRNEQDATETVENGNGSTNNSGDRSLIPIIQDDSMPDNTVVRTQHLVNVVYEDNSVAVNSAFFDVVGEGSDLRIRLNEEHPIYSSLKQAMETPSKNIEEIEQQLEAAQTVIDLLLKGWSIYEDEEPIGVRKQRVLSAREDWGRYIRNLLHNDGDE